MKFSLRSVLLAGALTYPLLLPSCMTFKVIGDGSKTADSCHGSETVHSSLYDFDWVDRDAKKCGEGHAIQRVQFTTNGLLLLASVLSLGLYVPQTVEWWCDAGTTDSGPVHIMEGGDDPFGLGDGSEESGEHEGL